MARRSSPFLAAASLVLAPLVLALAQTPVRPGSSAAGGSPDPNMARPIDGYDTVFLEEMTWLEVRDAMRAGKRTVILATGGIEMNGPYLALGKHNYVLRATTEAIARELGDALVAPIVAFVPEGNIDPPTGMMRYPGTISLTKATFKALLTEIAQAMRAHGFEQVILIGDSGGNQEGMKEVAAELTTAWGPAPSTTIHYIAEYYDYPGLTRYLETLGVHEVDEGHHDDIGISSQMAVVDPRTVRYEQRVKAGRASINGVSLVPLEKTLALGRQAVGWRARTTVAAIRKLRRR
jgi:creatinine amidohydrolase/Fe(II)-dependent formamide hydrolase-like protein